MLPSFRKVLAALVLVLCALWFIKRSFPGGRTLWDFAVFDASSHAWVSGHDPYDAQALWGWWTHGGLSPSFCDNINGLPPVAPPPSLVLFAPLALLPTSTAAVLWVAGSLMLLGLALVALAKLAELPLTSARAMLMMACVLLIAPTRIAMLTGQPGLPAAALIVLGIWAARADHQRMSGILFALSAALKVQLGLPFILIYLFMGRPRVVLWGLGTTVAIAAVAMIGLQLGTGHWWTSWQASLHTVNQPGGLNDFSPLNPNREEMLNLEFPINALISNRLLTCLLSVTIAGGFTILLLSAVARRPVESDSSTPSWRANELLTMAILAPLLLLPFYHRYYDGVILALTFAWVFREIRRPDPTLPILVVTVLLLALLTPQSLFWRLSLHLTPHLAQSAIYGALIVGHRVWILLFVVVALLHELIAPRVGRIPRMHLGCLTRESDPLPTVEAELAPTM